MNTPTVNTDEKTKVVAEKTNTSSYFKKNIREYALLMALIFIIALFQYLTEGVLLRPLNVTNLMLQNSYVVIMALGMLLIIIMGHIDLSVGSVCGFVGGFAAILLVNYDWHWFPTIIAGLLMGGVIGGVQGWFVAYANIPAFIVTLAGMLIFKGLALAVLQGQAIGPFPTEFQMLSTGFIPNFLGSEDSEFHLTSFIIGLATAIILSFFQIKKYRTLAKHDANTESFLFFIIKVIFLFCFVTYFCYLLAQYKGLPNVLVIMALLIGIYHFITTNMTFGRRVYALGSNIKAAMLSGVNTKRITWIAFVNMGMLAALAGMIFAARLNSATPKAGAGFELDVIAAVFIGGASPQGGVGKVIGAVLGAFIMGVMNNGMSIMGIGIDYQQVIKGVVLLAAVLFDVYNKNKA